MLHVTPDHLHGSEELRFHDGSDPWLRRLPLHWRRAIPWDSSEGVEPVTRSKESKWRWRMARRNFCRIREPIIAVTVPRLSMCLHLEAEDGILKPPKFAISLDDYSSLCVCHYVDNNAEDLLPK